MERAAEIWGRRSCDTVASGGGTPRSLTCQRASILSLRDGDPVLGEQFRVLKHPATFMQSLRDEVSQQGWHGCREGSGDSGWKSWLLTRFIYRTDRSVLILVGGLLEYGLTGQSKMWVVIPSRGAAQIG